MTMEDVETQLLEPLTRQEATYILGNVETVFLQITTTGFIEVFQLGTLQLLLESQSSMQL